MSKKTKPPGPPTIAHPPSKVEGPEGPPLMRPPVPGAPSRPGRDWHKVHLFQIQAVRDVLVILALAGLVYLGYVLRPVTVPMLLALALAYLFEPLIQRVTQSRYISRQGAAAGIIIIAGLLVVVPVTIGAGFAVVQGAQFAGAFAQRIGQVRGAVEDPQRLETMPEGAWRSIAEYLVELEQERSAAGRAPAPDELPEGVTEVQVGAVDPDVAATPLREQDNIAYALRLAVGWLEQNAAAIGQAVRRHAVGTGATAVSAAISTISSLGYLAFAAVLTAFFFFFFSTGWGRVLAFWESLVPEKKKGKVLDLVAKMDRVIAGFVRGRLTIVGIVMLYMTAAYWFIGVPAPLVVGPLVGLLFIVPFVHIIGVPLSMLLMWLEPSSSWAWQQAWWWIVFAPIVVYVIGQSLDDWILTPMIQGKSTDMDTPTILFASLAGGVLAGVYGLLLAIPVAACLKILIKELLWPRISAYLRGEVADALPIEKSLL